MADRPDPRFPNRLRRAGAFAALLSLAAGCTDSVAPAPTGQVDNVGDMGGYAASPILTADIPATSVPPANSGKQPTTSADKAHAAKSKPQGTPAAGDGFYAAASQTGSKLPGGPAVEADDRDAGQIDKAAAGHPALRSFDRASAKSLPAPDPKTNYVSVVDPADGEMPAADEVIDLATPGSAIDGVCFSSPAAAQAVLSVRVSESGKRDSARLDRYDLKSGKVVSSADLPDRAALLDVSPDGTRALVRLTFGLAPGTRPAASQTRLDVWELAETKGRYVAGWQPGAKGDGRPSVPIGAVMPDGDHVATMTEDGALTLWNLAEGKAVYTVENAGRGPLLATPGRKYLAVFTGTTFATFETETGAFRGLLTPPRATLAGCRDAAFSPDGKQLAAVLRRPAQSLLSWDVAAGRPSFEIDATLDLGRGLHFGSPGYVVAGGTLFDLDAKKPVWIYAENQNSRNIAASPDRRHWVVTQPAFGTPVLQAVDAPTDAVATAARSAPALKPARLAPGDALAVKLDLANPKGNREALEASFAKAIGRALGDRGLRLDPDAGPKLEVKVTEHSTGETFTFDVVGTGGDETVPAHEIDFTLAVSDEQGKTLWSGDGSVPPSTFVAKREGATLEQVLLEALWAAAPGAVAGAIENSMPSYFRDVPAESALGQTRLWAGAEDVSRPGNSSAASSETTTTSSGDPESAPARQPGAVVQLPAGTVRDLVVMPPPAPLIFTASEDKIRCLDPRNGRVIDEITTKGGATRFTLVPNSSQFLYGTEEGQVRAYDAVRRRPAASYEGAKDAVTAVAVTFEPTVVAGTQGGRVLRWTEADRSSPTVVADGQAPVTALAAVPYENRIVVVWGDGTVKLLDVGTVKTIMSYDLKAGPIYGVATSPDSLSATFATETAGAVTITLANGQPVSRFDTGPVTAVAYRPDGLQLATANRLGRIVLWSLSDGKPSVRLEGAGGEVSKIAFSADSQHALAAVAGRRVIPGWSLTGSPTGAAPRNTPGAPVPHNAPARRPPGGR